MVNRVISQLYGNGYFADFQNLRFPNYLDNYLDSLVENQKFNDFVGLRKIVYKENMTIDDFLAKYQIPANATPDQLKQAKEAYKNYLLEIYRKGQEKI